MAWRKRQEQPPEIPDWIRHETDGGFVAADWAEPDDFGLAPWLAESAARGRWIEARCRWLMTHEDVAGALIEQLRERVRRIP